MDTVLRGLERAARHDPLARRRLEQLQDKLSPLSEEAEEELLALDPRLTAALQSLV